MVQEWTWCQSHSFLRKSNTPSRPWSHPLRLRLALQWISWQANLVSWYLFCQAWASWSTQTSARLRLGCEVHHHVASRWVQRVVDCALVPAQTFGQVCLVLWCDEGWCSVCVKVTGIRSWKTKEYHICVPTFYSSPCSALSWCWGWGADWGRSWGQLCDASLLTRHLTCQLVSSYQPPAAWVGTRRCQLGQRSLLSLYLFETLWCAFCTFTRPSYSV